MNELQTIETVETQDLASLPAGQRALFDYGALDQETQVLVRLRAGEIKSLAKRVAGDIVEIGGKLAEVKDRIGGNGKFNEWLSAELGWSERTAYNFIAVWQKFGAANFALENVATSALYLLAAPSTPAEAVESARRIANEGGEVSHAVAKAIVAEAKESERRKTRPDLFEEADGDQDTETEAEADDESPIAEDPAQAKSAEKQRPARTAAAAPAKARPSSSAKEIETAWRKLGVMITIQLLPAKHAERQAMVTIRAGDLEPLNKVKPESEIVFGGPVLELIEQYKRELPAKMAKAKPAAKSTAKSAPKAKAGKKATTKTKAKK